MNKKSSSQSAFFNFRVLLLLCAVGALVVLAAFGARPGGSAKPQPSAQDQNGGLAQPGNNNLSPSGPGLLPRQRASSSSFNLMEAPASDGATVTTDKADYAPGETVVISGTGWIANQEVALHIDDSNGVARWDASVTADGAGNISNSGFVIQSGDVGLAFTLTATQGAVTAWTQFTDVVGAGVAPNGDPGGFEIDGNLRAGNAIPVPGGTDWLDTTSVSGVGGLLFETGIPKNPLVTGPASGPHIDPANCGSACDDVFTGGSGGPNDNPSTTWFWQTGASNAKTDMNNAYFHISTSANGHRWITASGDRFSTNGTAYIDFELLQQTLTRNVQTGCVKPPCGNFTSAAPASTGGRTVNDLLITAAYGNGGTVATLGVSQWRQVSPGVYQYVDVTNSIPNNTAFVATSLDPNGVPVPYGAFGATPGTYVPNQFVEFSIDLTALLTVIGDPCEGIQIKTLMVKTKTSTALTATLEDMLPPFQISFSAGFIVSATGTSPACSTGFGTVTGTFSGGIGPFECQLDDGSFASCTSPVTYNNVGSGSHTVTVKDDGATGCQKTSDAVIITIPSAVTASSSPSPILCHGGSSTVTVSASGGTAPYSGTGTFTRSAGTYSFTVTDAHSCTGTTTGTITQPAAVVASSSNTAILCHGGSSTVTVSASGGTAPYSGTGTFTRSAGTYSFTVTDANSCTDTTTGNITQPAAVVASSSNTAILCHGGSSTVTVSASGGTAPYSGTGTFSVPAGTYSFTVTDANSCTDTTTGNITQPAGVVASSSNTAILCHGGSSTVTVSASGGTAPYSGTGTFTRSAGTYSFTVTDANSCTDTTTGNITQPAGVVASSSNTAILCHGGSSTVTVSASGGTAPYSGTGTFTRSAGTYSFTVTDANSCTDTTTGNITQPATVVASSSNTAILCHGGSSTVTVSASGGTAPYSGTGTFTRSAGTYSFTVTDANSCTDTTTGNITQPATVVASSSNTAILCHGGSSTVTVSASGGTAPYSGTGTFSVPAGTYSFTVTDANSCTDTTTGNITQPAGVVASSSNTAILCHGGSSTVTVSASGGTAPYSGTGTFSVPAGTYSFTVTDANSCTDTTTGNITQPAGVVASSSNTAILCHGGSSTVTVSASGGTAPYSGTGTFTRSAGTYSFTVTDANSCTDTTTGNITQPAGVVASSSNTAILCHGGSSTVTVSASGGTAPYSGTGTFTRSAGTYSFTVTDANSCTDTTTGNITQPAGVVASSSNTAILCHGGSSTVTVSASGGTAPYSGTGTFTRSAGTYSFTVTDANSCTDTTTGNITQPAAVVASSSNTAILCHGGNSTVSVSASGGTPPYNGTGMFSHAAGTYSYTVTDANSCTATTTGTINEPAAVVASSSNTAILCHGGNSTVSVSASGGTPPYNGTGDFTHAAGTYSYTVTDANGCLATTTGNITQPAAVVASSSKTAILCNGGSSTVTVSATGGTGPYSGTGTFTRSAGTYSFTVTDANGCTDTTTGNITQPTAVTLGLVKGCNDFNSGFITATFGGGTPGYQCSLDGGPFGACTSPTTFNNLSGPHSVTVRDTNLCSNTQQITVDSCQGFCALTQGAYGNAGGIFTSPHSCYNNLGTLALIRALLGNPLFTGCGSPNPNPQSLIVGILGTRSLTIPLSAAQCIITRLPAGGPPSALPNFGDKTLQNPNSCQVSGIPALPLNNGKFYNVLLGQTITLGLNLRLDPTLANVDLAHIGTPVVINGKAYRQFCTQSGGNIQTWRISQAVINALSNSTFVPDPTHRGKVSGLLDLANRALAGLPTGAASISDINAAVNAINSGFDECRMLVTCPIR